MDKRAFDAITIITAVVLLPLIALSGHAYYVGKIEFMSYVGLWEQPLALLFGFWLRGTIQGDSDA